MIVTDHHIAICTAMEKVLAGKTKRLIINIAPRVGKTAFAVVNFMSWCLGLYPNSKFVHISYSADLSGQNSYEARDMVQSEAFKELFPDLEIKTDSKARNHWKTTAGGVVYATSALGQLTGFGAGDKSDKFAGAIIIDDVQKAQSAYSENERQKINDWFTQTLYSRINSPDTPIIVIMQRLATTDLAGFLLDGGNGQKWEHLCLPVLDENDESLLPQFLPTDELHRMRAANPTMFSGQYQQEPVVKGGNMMKEDWIRWYNKYTLPDVKFSFITADTAQKTKERNDFSVFQHWMYGVDNNLYLIDMRRIKCESPELEQQFKDFYAKSNSLMRVRCCYVEDKSSGSGLIQSIRRNANIPIKAVQRNIDKVVRCGDASPWMEQGKVYMNKDIGQIDVLKTELVEFPNSAHDDTIDPMFDAIDVAFNQNQGEASVSYGGDVKKNKYTNYG